MKKLIVIIIVLVYGLTSTGAVVHLDYCCGKLANISLVPVDKKDCPDKNLTSNSCCDSKHILLKVKGEQEVSVKWENVQKQSLHPVLVPTGLAQTFHQYEPVLEFSTGPPIKESQAPLFLQHCHFRI